MRCTEQGTTGRARGKRMCGASDAPGSEQSSALILSESDSETGDGAAGGASSARTAAKRKLLFSPAHKRVVKKVSS